jgi:thioesterase domain-containing protein
VALLAILDSGAPINARQIIELEDRMGINDSVMLAMNIIDQARRGGKEPPFVLSDLLRLELERQLSYIVDLAKKADVLPPEIGLVEIDVYLQLQRSRREVVRNYIPQDYPGRITLFRTTEPSNDGLSSFYEMSDPELLASLLREQEIVLSSPTLGWEQLSAEPIELHLVPGDHHTMLFEPNVALLAERLGELISKAEASALIAC